MQGSWFKIYFLVQRTVVNEIKNIFSTNFIWLKLCDTKYCRKFSLVNITTELFPALNLRSFFNSEVKKTQENNFMDHSYSITVFHLWSLELDQMLISCYMLILCQKILLQEFSTDNRWIWTYIDYDLITKKLI